MLGIARAGHDAVDGQRGNCEWDSFPRRIDRPVYG